MLSRSRCESGSVLFFASWAQGVGTIATKSFRFLDRASSVQREDSPVLKSLLCGVGNIVETLASVVSFGLFLRSPAEIPSGEQSLAVGDGHSIFASFFLPCEPPFPGRHGVGHIPRSVALTMTFNDVIVFRGPPFMRSFIARWASTLLLSSCATGVGQNPDPVPLMRSSGVGSSEHAPFRIEPHLGQVTEDDIKPARGKEWGIFHEDESRSHFANDSRHLFPEAGAFACDAVASSRCGNVLTGKPSRNHVNNPSPRASVKGSHVIPDRERRQKSIILSLDEYRSGIGFVFDGADCSPSEDVSCEYASTSAREKCQLIHAPAPSLKFPPSRTRP